MAKLVRHYRRHGHRLRLIRSDPDNPLLAAADLLEDKFRGLKMRHANPEEHERVFENFYKTIKGTRPAADLLPFGATVMVRKGRARKGPAPLRQGGLYPSRVAPCSAF